VELPVLRDLLLLVPEAALVLRPGAQVPRLDQETLRGVDIALCVDLLDADLHAILGEDNILGLDFFIRSLGDLLHRDVEVVGEDGDADEENEQDK
jgi:hypothetical protein